jgi:hypothetical protein
MASCTCLAPLSSVPVPHVQRNSPPRCTTYSIMWISFLAAAQWMIEPCTCSTMLSHVLIFKQENFGFEVQSCTRRQFRTGIIGSWYSVGEFIAKTKRQAPNACVSLKPTDERIAYCEMKTRAYCLKYALHCVCMHVVLRWYRHVLAKGTCKELHNDDEAAKCASR